MSDINIHLEHITRVEGHGNIVLNAKDGKIEKVQWQVPESPRLFEAMLRGRDWNQLAHITSRICGICSIGHSLASLKATEAAMGVQISEQTALLRRLTKHSENIQSHVLHVGYLIAPDLFGVGSVFPLISTNPVEVKKIISLHRLANEMADLLCGRTVHPISLVVGGFSKIPTEKQLRTLKEKLVNCVQTTLDVAGVVKANAGKLPNFTRETEYIGLTSSEEYALYDGDIGSTDTGRHPVDDYLSITNEFVVPHSTAKHTKHARESYMVGALARFNLNYDQLDSHAKDVAEMFALKPKNCNPYMNSIAQLVETVHSIFDSIKIIDRLLEMGLKEEKVKIVPKAGRGVGAVDVPRGILFHDYTIDSNGKCVKANCIIPTNQNHHNIQKDFEALAPLIINWQKKNIELTLEMLVRAYDPCISCSTHYLDVKFV